MAALLSKFRIDYKEVFVIPEIFSKPNENTLQQFNDLIRPFIKTEKDQTDDDDEVYTSEAELLGCQTKVSMCRLTVRI